MQHLRDAAARLIKRKSVKQFFLGGKIITCRTITHYTTYQKDPFRIYTTALQLYSILHVDHQIAKTSLPCVCISGPPHRLLWRERKSFVNMISLYQRPLIHFNSNRLFTNHHKTNSQMGLSLSYPMLLAEDALTLSYNPKDLKFIHHITDVRNLHQVKRWRGGACLGREERKAEGWDRNLRWNGSLQQNSAPGWS